jgi:hypothetical protein
MKGNIMTWEIKIRRIYNGFIVTLPSDLDEDVTYEEAIVCSPDIYPEEKCDCDITKSLCELIIEHFGPSWSKHNAYNLKVEIVETEGD